MLKVFPAMIIMAIFLIGHGYIETTASKVGIIGVPFGRGQTYGFNKTRGLELAPDAIRKNIKDDMLAMGIDLEDYGQVSYVPFDDNTSNIDICLKNFNYVIPNMNATSVAVSRVLKDGRTCLVLGGDHSLFTGSLHGHLQEKGEDDVAVIYIDAHADINRCDTTLTGNMHGMDVSVISKEFSSYWVNLPHMEWIKYRLPLRNFAYIGLRAVDPGEQVAIEQYNIAAYTMTDVVEVGIASILKQALQRIDESGHKSIHLSVDVDSIDPMEAPDVTTPERGGLSLREVLYLVEKVRSTGRLSVVELVEVNPIIGSEQDQKLTLHTAKLIALTAVGHVHAPGIP